MTRPLTHLFSFALGLFLSIASSTGFAANPIVPGYYADPEIRIFDGQYWIYPTWSASEDTPDQSVKLSPTQITQRKQPNIWAPFLKQTFLDAFSSKEGISPVAKR